MKLLLVLLAQVAAEDGNKDQAECSACKQVVEEIRQHKGRPIHVGVCLGADGSANDGLSDNANQPREQDAHTPD